MKIGIATCVEKPNLTSSDRLLVVSLENQGVQVIPFIWNSPSLSSLKLDAVVLRSTWDYHKKYAEFEKWIGEIKKSSLLLFNSPEVTLWNMNKKYLLELFRHEVSIVPSLIFSRLDDAHFIAEQIQSKQCLEIIVKPTISATAFLTFKTSLLDPELPRLITQIQGHSDVLIQPYVSSIVSDGEISLIFFNGEQIEFSHAVLKRPQKSDFRVQSDFGGTEVLFSPTKEIINFASASLEMIPGDWLYVRVDIVHWQIEPMISEIELIEPDLFLTFELSASDRLASALLKKLSRG